MRTETVFVLGGALDAARVPDVRVQLHAAVDAAADRLIVDMAGVDRVDVTGLGLLVDAHRRASRRGCRLVLRDLRGPVTRMLVITRLHRILHVERTVNLEQGVSARYHAGNG
jgi:anti-anti-sigma factor